MRGSFTQFAIAASLAHVAVAQQGATCPNKADPSKNPSGNPIATPGLHQNVPTGQPFDITWKPTTSGTVSILLLKGPATNLIGADCIASSVANTGSYTWTFPDSLTASDKEGYGIQIIVDQTKGYQYSDQFGISNNKKVSSSSEHASKSTSAAESGAHSSKSGEKHVTKTDKSTVTTSCSSSSSATGTAHSLVPHHHHGRPVKGNPLQNGTVHHFSSAKIKTHSVLESKLAKVSTVHESAKPAKSTASAVASEASSAVAAVFTTGSSSPTETKPASSTTSVQSKPANAGVKTVAGGFFAAVGAFAALLL